MTTETLLHIAVVFASIVAIVAFGLWMLNEIFDAKELPELTDQRGGNTPKPPPGPEH